MQNWMERDWPKLQNNTFAQSSSDQTPSASSTCAVVSFVIVVVDIVIEVVDVVADLGGSFAFD